MANGLSDHDPPHAMQLGAMLRREGVNGNGKGETAHSRPVPIVHLMSPGSIIELYVHRIRFLPGVR